MGRLLASTSIKLMDQTLTFEGVEQYDDPWFQPEVPALNDYVLREIFAYLSVPEALKAARVCKAWRRLIHEWLGSYALLTIGREVRPGLKLLLK